MYTDNLDWYIEYKEQVNSEEDTLREAFHVLRKYSSHVPDLVNHVIQTEHRTHQQNIMRNLASMMSKYGDTACADLRNEASVNWAKKQPPIPIYSFLTFKRKGYNENFKNQKMDACQLRRFR